MGQKGKCSTCANAVFDIVWGEYKCRMYNKTMYSPNKWQNCEHYEHGTPDISSSSTEDEE